jgi:mycoredoxin
MTGPAIHVYGTEWCPDCWRSKRLLDRLGVPYRWTNISHDEQAQEFVTRVNRGMRSVPTIVFPDGAVLVEPSDADLVKKLAALGITTAPPPVTPKRT